MKKIKDILTEKGFVENVDYTLSGCVVTPIAKIREIAGSPAVIDQATGEVITPEMMPSSEEYFEAIPSLQDLIKECLLSCDVGAILNEYLKEFPDHEGDINLFLYIQTGEGWRMNIPAPTIEQLYLLADKAFASVRQDEINREVKEYLASTDWYIIRELETGKECPEDIKAKRSEMRLKYKA